MNKKETPTSQDSAFQSPESKNRLELVEQWRAAPESLIRYPAGRAVDSEGNIYEYGRGTRLIILDQEVMDSCQTPWARETVNKAFDVLTERRRGIPQDVKVLERGFGMGIVATRIMEHLAVTGGDYTTIELNEQVAKYAEEEWKSRQMTVARERAMGPIGGTYRDAIETGINVIKGEAFEETKKLVTAGKKFDIIISDTYPLSDEEKSINDLVDIEQLIKCLAPDGVFAFFGYHAGSDGTMNAKQRNAIEKYFGNINTTYVNVSPPPDYKYFNPKDGHTVRRLPVIICTDPRTDIAA